jgi:phosphoribosylamine--glycine ligase
MYLRAARAGHEVRVFSSQLAEHGTMRGMVAHVADYREQLDWVRGAGDEGYIVFESADQGAEQDALRREGFYVVGGSEYGDRLENDRAFGQAALSAVGLQVVPSHAFDNFERAQEFVRRRARRYVFKLDGSDASSWRNVVGQAPDGSDMLALLQTQHERLARVGLLPARFVLMDHVEGVETGVGAYFDGQAFLRPVCLDWEHKHLFAGDVGELTGEMGTLVTYEHAEPLFSASLSKLAPLLREHGYVGYINLNTIVNEHGIWPLELTCRFGYPGYAILDALQSDGWPALFRAMRARSGSFAARPGYALGVVLSVPPYPYRYGYSEIARGLPITLAPELSADASAALHWGEVEWAGGQLITSGVIGYTGVATGVGDSVEAAQAQAYAVARQVFVPNLRYRTDIGASFLARGQAALRSWGYLPSER